MKVIVASTSSKLPAPFNGEFGNMKNMNIYNLASLEYIIQASSSVVNRPVVEEYMVTEKRIVCVIFQWKIQSGSFEP